MVNSKNTFKYKTPMAQHCFDMRLGLWRDYETIFEGTTGLTPLTFISIANKISLWCNSFWLQTCWSTLTWRGPFSNRSATPLNTTISASACWCSVSAAIHSSWPSSSGTPVKGDCWHRRVVPSPSAFWSPQFPCPCSLDTRPIFPETNSQFHKAVIKPQSANALLKVRH